MLLKLILIALWAFVAGLNLHKAIDEGGFWPWCIFVLDMLCSVLWIASAYMVYTGT